MSEGATMRPRIGITWGSNATANAMRKLCFYVDCVRAAGGEPVAVLPLAAIGDAVQFVSRHDAGLFQLHAGEGAAARDFSGLLFAGGRDVDPVRYGEAHGSPALDIDGPRDGIELPLISGALSQGVPVFGICRGMQLLNVALGGKLFQDIPTQHAGAIEHREGPFHEIEIVPGSRLHRLAGERRVVRVNSWHHQGIKLPDGLAPGLVATAFAADGIVEACEPEPGRFPGYVVAVQWHPERPHPDDARETLDLTTALFADFVAACKIPAPAR